MTMRMDHIVLWVADPLAAIDFYRDVVGLTGVRVEEYREGAAPFPSVRVSDDTLIDLMARGSAPGVDRLTEGPGSAGHPVNHVCLAMDRDRFDALRQRLTDAGAHVTAIGRNSFGAQGHAAGTFYFRDPDGNILEARHYD